ncbi:membrane protein [Lysobacter helvus]|uniref:Membrane protein n=2 Tax=Lysobacteraceae TaxID=32033 RepID=A0ABM7Q639_9GAMM|nr:MULTISPECIES: NfeD family protein [Lysobacter]BCT92768.1 membrane protein [Lysobacter caseinilyticus]BCT95921.1 membrane protein [Lysobacter helvus]
MRMDVFAWAAIALLLCAAEMIAPGAFLLWLGFAAAAVFFVVLLVPGISVLSQAVLFGVLGVLSILAWRRWARGRGRASDDPVLNKRTAALIGRVVPLERGIVNGHGRVQIADAFWDVVGPELPAGTPVRVLSAEGMTLRVEAAG